MIYLKKTKKIKWINNTIFKQIKQNWKQILKCLVK